jgi:imidazolonepropionase-like amidohydrolase
MLRRLLVTLILASGVAMVPAQTKITAVRFGTLVDGLGHTTRDAVVVIEGDRITRVGSGNGAVPKGAELIDLRGFTGIPGLIDLHTHITYYWDGAPGTRPQGRRTTPLTVELVAKNGLRTLETGVTTVRDLGASGGLDYALRDAINAGSVIGPRLFVAGQGLSADRNGGPAPIDIPALVDARAKAGSDWIKVYGSRGSFQSVETTQTLNYDQMKAAVDAAHAAGRPIAIHSYGASGVKDAVRAGANSVEHGIELDDETIADMVQRGTVWVPTIDHNRYYIDARDEYGWAPDVVGPLQDYIDKNLESTKRAFKAGVKIGMGSDAVYSMFGQNTRELAWMIKAGMTPAQALATATTIPAALLGHAKELGAVAPGYFADLVAVEGDPLKDIGVVIDKVKVVIKGGTVVVDHR